MIKLIEWVQKGKWDKPWYLGLMILIYKVVAISQTIMKLLPKEDVPMEECGWGKDTIGKRGKVYRKTRSPKDRVKGKLNKIRER